MKKCRIILITFLFLIVMPFPSLAGIETTPAKLSLQNDRLKKTGTHEVSHNLNMQDKDSGKGEEKQPRLHIRNRLRTQKLTAGKNVGSKLSAQKRMTPLSGRVAFVQGEASVQLGGRGNWVCLKAGDAIPPQSNLKTRRGGTLEIRYEDGSSLLLRSDTDVTIIEAWKTRTGRLLRDFFLSAGRVIAKVQSATGHSPRFRVHTPSAIASVRGTEFRVSVDKKLETFVEVLESKVTVDTATNVINLAKGEGAMIRNVALPSSARKLLAPPKPLGLQPFYNVSPSFSFERIDGAQAYRVMAAKDPQGKQVVRERVVKPGESCTMNSLPDGAYYLLTQSIDPIGLEGPPSPAYPFTIRESPLPPMMLIPGEGQRIKDKAAILAWLAVSDAIRYHLQISEDREFRKLILDKPDVTVVTLKVDGLEKTPCYFRIRSIAKDDYAGAWSDPLSLTLSPMPTNSAENSPALSSDQITLRSRGEGTGFSYRIQVARDQQFREILMDQRVNRPELTFEKPGEPGLYFARIAPIAPNGNAGEFSQPQSFTIQKRFPYEWVGGGGGILLLLLLLAL